MNDDKLVWWVAAFVVLVGAAGGGYYWWKHREPPRPAVSAPPPAIEAPAPAPAPVEPAIKNPLDTESEAPPLPPPDRADAYVANALVDLLGRKPVAMFLVTDGFAERFVTTVDNLARDRAPSRLWPVKPSAGRFIVTTGQEVYIGADNAARYAGFVRFVEAVDPAKAVALYKRLYPLFQHAYEQLGYPRKYFNDRVIEVIDDLLATPAVEGPVKVVLTEVKGPIEPTRPWVRYEYADPALEARSAGQKILLRMGDTNAQKLKAKLEEVRRLIAKGAAP